MNPRLIRRSLLGLVLLGAIGSATAAVAQRATSPSDSAAPVAAEQETKAPATGQTEPATRSANGIPPAVTGVAEPAAQPVEQHLTRRQTLVASLTIFVLAVFVGFEVIAKVPPTLHTPLMSGSNAISGITLVGALIVAAYGFYASTFLGFLAVILATINVVGGFLVTHRMLAMFKRK